VAPHRATGGAREGAEQLWSGVESSLGTFKGLSRWLLQPTLPFSATSFEGGNSGQFVARVFSALITLPRAAGGGGGGLGGLWGALGSSAAALEGLWGGGSWGALVELLGLWEGSGSCEQ
jgi:hypothetical protein